MSKQSIWEWSGLESAHERTTKREILKKVEDEFNAEVDSLISDRNAFFVFRNTGKWREGYELHYDIKFSLIRNEDLDQEIEDVIETEEVTITDDIKLALEYVDLHYSGSVAGERIKEALERVLVKLQATKEELQKLQKKD